MKNVASISSLTGEMAPHTLRLTQFRTNQPHQEPKHGAITRPRCADCKSFMKLTRREAHPTRGPNFELQTFICGKCAGVEYACAASPGAS